MQAHFMCGWALKIALIRRRCLQYLSRDLTSHHPNLDPLMGRKKVSNYLGCIDRYLWSV
jgi:hypothetical protein